MTSTVIWVIMALAGTVLFGWLLANSVIDLWIARSSDDEGLLDLAVGDVRAHAILLLGQLVFLLAGSLVLGATFLPYDVSREPIIVCLLVGEAATMLAGLVLHRARAR